MLMIFQLVDQVAQMNCRDYYGSEMGRQHCLSAITACLLDVFFSSALKRVIKTACMGYRYTRQASRLFTLIDNNNN